MPSVVAPGPVLLHLMGLWMRLKSLCRRIYREKKHNRECRHYRFHKRGSLNVVAATEQFSLKTPRRIYESNQSRRAKSPPGSKSDDCRYGKDHEQNRQFFGHRVPRSLYADVEVYARTHPPQRNKDERGGRHASSQLQLFGQRTDREPKALRPEQ